MVDAVDKLDTVLESVKEMILRMRAGDSRIDNMLSRATKTSEKIGSMKRYERMLDEVRDLTVNGNRRKLILNDLQRENRQIMALQDENRQLRESTDEYLGAIRDIVETHTEIRKTIEGESDQPPKIEPDHVLYELPNRSIEQRLLKDGMRIQRVMDDLELRRREQKQNIILAIEKNKVYRQMFKSACLSNPSALNILCQAMSKISAEIDDRVLENDEEDEEEAEAVSEVDTDLNSTMVRKF